MSKIGLKFRDEQTKVYCPKNPDGRPRFVLKFRTPVSKSEGLENMEFYMYKERDYFHIKFWPYIKQISCKTRRNPSMKT